MRQKLIQVKVTEDEFQRIKAEADKLGLSISAFIRFLVMIWSKQKEKVKNGK